MLSKNFTFHKGILKHVWAQRICIRFFFLKKRPNEKNPANQDVSILNAQKKKGKMVKYT